MYTTSSAAVWYQVTIKGTDTPVYTTPEEGERFAVEAGANLQALKPVVEQMKLGEEVSLEVKPSCTRRCKQGRPYATLFQQMASRSHRAACQLMHPWWLRYACLTGTKWKTS